MLQNERVSIYYGTKEAYEVEKQNKRINENALYFIEGVLYSGYELYTQEYHKVTSYPSIGQKNCIYINTLDSSVSIWDDDTNEWLYLSKSTVGVDEAINELKAEIEELSEITAEEIKTNQSELESHTKNNVIHITNDERELWDDKYTKVEIDNKFSAFETDIDWKEAVNTYDDIVATYPNPKDGWTVNVKDTDYTYRYNGTEWVTISANATPKATNEVDGLLSKEDHTKYEETYNQKHSHSNKSILDTITSAIIDAWNSAVTHISDTVKHITSTERTNWNDANDKKHTHSNKSILDNTTASYTTAEQTKLSGIATGAEVNQNAFSNVVVGTTTISADSKTDSLTLVGSNVTLTPDTTNDKVTIGITKANVTTALGYTPPTTNTTYSAATTSANGLMTSTDKTKLDATNIAYGTCSTAAATAAKVITISGNTNWALTAGSRITVKFSYTNTASNPTFNVNGTGAKSVWYNTALITTSNLAYAGTANRPMDFVYDGTQYIFVGWSIDSNTTYSNATLGQGYGTCATAEATTAKVVTLSSYSLVTGGIVAVKFTYAVPASATMNINSKGAKNIYYRGSAITAGVIKAGDIGVFIYDGTQYHLLTIDRDSNTTYTLSSFGITATATELNYVDGVTSNIQTQLDGKAATSHGTHVTYGTSASALGTSSAGSATTVSRSDHVHALPALTSCTGTLTVAKGGTGATDASTARTNLGITPANIGAATSEHSHSSYVNQNAFSNVTVGSTTISADTTTDTLTLVAGSNVTITPDATNDKITISSTNTTYSNATTSTVGLMSASDKTKLDGIASGANKTTLATNLTTSTVGYALDATMGKDLYNYVRMLQTDVVYLKYLTNALTEDFVEAKYIKNHSHSELGSVNVAYMPYEKMTTLTTSNKVIVGFTNGAVGIFSVDVAAGNTLGRTITWIRGSVPYVSKTTVQSGTNTLALASGSGAYTTYDREIYVSTGETKQTLVFEFSATSSNISVFYKIINTNDGFNSLSETETDMLMQ